MSGRSVEQARHIDGTRPDNHIGCNRTLKNPCAQPSIGPTVSPDRRQSATIRRYRSHRPHLRHIAIQCWPRPYQRHCGFLAGMYQFNHPSAPSCHSQHLCHARRDHQQRFRLLIPAPVHSGKATVSYDTQRLPEGLNLPVAHPILLERVGGHIRGTMEGCPRCAPCDRHASQFTALTDSLASKICVSRQLLRDVAPSFAHHRMFLTYPPLFSIQQECDFRHIAHASWCAGPFRDSAIQQSFASLPRSHNVLTFALRGFILAASTSFPSPVATVTKGFDQNRIDRSVPRQRTLRRRPRRFCGSFATNTDSGRATTLSRRHVKTPEYPCPKRCTGAAFHSARNISASARSRVKQASDCQTRFARAIRRLSAMI